MGCNSDYQQQTDKERLLQETAQLYAYALKRFGKKVPAKVLTAAKTSYCTDDFVPDLCKLLKDSRRIDDLFLPLTIVILDDDYGTLPEDYADRVTCAKLMLWWMEHQQADFLRKRSEQAEIDRKAAKKKAAAKLTPKERKLLGIKE